MIISLIAAMSEERVIGLGGKLPWNIPTDLARFKTITMGHAVLMGRKTYESIGQPLPGRRTIVLTSRGGEIPGCRIARSLPEAIRAAEGEEELFVCGGEMLYREALPFCQRIYLTLVHGSFSGDVRFPEIPEDFQEMQREERPETTPPLSFLVYERVELLEPGSDAGAFRRKGNEAMRRELYFLARRCFEQALALAEDPHTAADLAFCTAKTGGDCRQALKLAEDALAQGPDDPHLHLMLGRVQILAGEKEKGLRTLRRGLQLGGNGEFAAELNRCGTRVPPLFPTLTRSHPLNRYLGLFLKRLGFR